MCHNFRAMRFHLLLVVLDLRLARLLFLYNGLKLTWGSGPMAIGLDKREAERGSVVSKVGLACCVCSACSLGPNPMCVNSESLYFMSPREHA